MESNLSLKIPPPAVALASAAGMWICSRLVPSLNIQLSTLKTVAIILVAIGLLIEITAVAQFFKNKTTINPLAPDRSRTLVIAGLYKYSRNPMYLGMLLLLTGYCLWLGNLAGSVMLVLVVWYLTQFQIKPEEKALLKIFGTQYEDYLNRVSRWFSF